jgi:hypothetical protein
MITKSSQHNEFITETVKNRDHDYQKFTTHEFNIETMITESPQHDELNKKKNTSKLDEK